MPAATVAEDAERCGGSSPVLARTKMAEEEALEGPTATAPALLPTMPGIIPQELSHEECFNVRNPVSYTHLTLPTILRV